MKGLFHRRVAEIAEMEVLDLSRVVPGTNQEPTVALVIQ